VFIVSCFNGCRDVNILSNVSLHNCSKTKQIYFLLNGEMNFPKLSSAFFQREVKFQLENTKLEIPMPKSVLNCTLTSTQGKYTFDPVAKVLSWDVGKIDSQKSPNIRGTVSIPPHRGLSIDRIKIIYSCSIRDACVM
jgi:Adaptor complexes medium subunit family